MGLLDLFFSQLDGSKTPPGRGRAMLETPDTRRAIQAFFALTKLVNFMPESDAFDQQIIPAWPGVYKWSTYLFTGRIQNPHASPEGRQLILDVVTGAWYSLSRSRIARRVMRSTPGSVELATRMWVFEGQGDAYSIIDGPSPSAVLLNLMRDDVKFEALSRILSAMGGQVDNLVKFHTPRLRSALSERPLQGVRMGVYLDLIRYFSTGSTPLRNAFLAAKSITLCTKAACEASKLLNADGPQQVSLNLMVTSFAYLRDSLEATDGFSWVIQSVKAGLLKAFADCSPYLHELEPEDREAILDIFKIILPKYLTYRSVILAVDSALGKLTKSSRDRVERSSASEIWARFRGLAHYRSLMAEQAKLSKKYASRCANDNVRFFITYSISSLNESS